LCQLDCDRGIRERLEVVEVRLPDNGEHHEDGGDLLGHTHPLDGAGRSLDPIALLTLGAMIQK
jgi:hypothetical protein